MRYVLVGLILLMSASPAFGQGTPAAPRPATAHELQQRCEQLEARVAALEARLAKLEGPTAAPPTSRPAAKQNTYDIVGLYRAVPADLRASLDTPGNHLLAERLQAWADRELTGNRLRATGEVKVIPPAGANAKTFEMTIAVPHKSGEVTIESQLTCTFPAALLDKAARLKDGQRVRVIGTIVRVQLDPDRTVAATLADCAFE